MLQTVRLLYLAGIQRYFIAGALGLGTGVGLNKFYDYNAVKRDAVMRHYMQLHPDLFPPPRKQYFVTVLGVTTSSIMVSFFSLSSTS